MIQILTQVRNNSSCPVKFMVMFDKHDQKLNTD